MVRRARLRAARNHGLNYLAHMQADSALVGRWARLCLERSDAVLGQRHPGSMLFRDLFWRQVREAVWRLQPASADLFIRRLSGAKPRELSCGYRSAHAVNQRLTQSRCRLRTVLAEQGNSETELRSYLALIRPAVMWPAGRPESMSA